MCQAGAQAQAGAEEDDATSNVIITCCGRQAAGTSQRIATHRQQPSAAGIMASAAEEQLPSCCITTSTRTIPQLAEKQHSLDHAPAAAGGTRQRHATWQQRTSRCNLMAGHQQRCQAAASCRSTWHHHSCTALPGSSHTC